MDAHNNETCERCAWRGRAERAESALAESEATRNSIAVAMSQAVIRADKESARVERVRRALEDAQVNMVVHSGMDEETLAAVAARAIKVALR